MSHISKDYDIENARGPNVGGLIIAALVVVSFLGPFGYFAAKFIGN